MTFLADANLICEQTKSHASAQAVQWLDDHDEEIVIDAVVLAEVWDGIVALPDGRKKQDLEGWFARLRRSVICLSWTGDRAVAWGDLKQEVRRRGFTVGIKDTMIAATAKLHGLTV